MRAYWTSVHVTREQIAPFVFYTINCLVGVHRGSLNSMKTIPHYVQDSSLQMPSCQDLINDMAAGIETFYKYPP